MASVIARSGGLFVAATGVRLDQAGRFCFVPGEGEDDLAEIELDAEHVRAFLGLPDLDVGWRPE
jgi:hypothetical protein